MRWFGKEEVDQRGQRIDTAKGKALVCVQKIYDVVVDWRFSGPDRTLKDRLRAAERRTSIAMIATTFARFMTENAVSCAMIP
jgi:hypothetical protein